MIERSKEIGLRENILAYIGNHYEKNSKPPSIRTLVEKVHGLNRSKFYEIFPGGIAEPCSELGIPAPMERIASTTKARKSKRDNPQGGDDEFLYSIMRFLGEPNPQTAKKKAIKVIADYSAYSTQLGLKDAAALGKYYEEKNDQNIDRIVELASENGRLRENYYYENDEELMALLDVPQSIKRRFRKFKRGRNIREDEFRGWLFGTFIELYRQMEEVWKEEESRAGIFI